MSDVVPVRDAATVMLVRDGAGGLEVYLQRRHHELVFTPGAYVFPGGAVDDEDAAGPCADAFRNAAIRECIEEAGAFLALDGDDYVDLSDAITAARFEDHRRAIALGEAAVADVLAHEGLTAACDRLRKVARWLTPLPAPRRYDTRFFLAPAPPAQSLVHDDGESVESLWIRPADALDRFDTGAFELIRPTEESLRVLSGLATVDDAMAETTAWQGNV